MIETVIAMDGAAIYRRTYLLVVLFQCQNVIAMLLRTNKYCKQLSADKQTASSGDNFAA